MNIKVDKSKSSIKQLEYFSMANWKKIETMIIQTQEETLDIKNIEKNFNFPLLQSLLLEFE